MMWEYMFNSKSRIDALVRVTSGDWLMERLHELLSKLSLASQSLFVHEMKFIFNIIEKIIYRLLKLVKLYIWYILTDLIISMSKLYFQYQEPMGSC